MFENKLENKNVLLKDIDRVLVTKEDIDKMVKKLGSQISKDYEGKDLLMISVLKGSIVFFSDILRAITIPIEIDFMITSSYGSGSKTSGVVKIVKDLDINIENKDILIIEDIVDSGLTLSYLTELLQSRNPASVKVCAILNKPTRRQAEIKVDYSGFEIPDEFAVGYGLDYNEKYRNLDFVGVLKREVYEI